VPATPPIETATLVVPSVPAPAPVQRPEADLSRMIAWQAMVLSGPAGTGKSSIAQQFCEILPKAAHIKVEPLRDNAYSVLVAQPMSRTGVDDGAKAEVWTGKTEEARQQAIDLAKAYVHLGYYVIIDDVLELPPEVSFYQDGLEGLTVRTVTLMPALEEMERRDKYRPVELQAGARIKELYHTMSRQLGALSTVLDTSSETVPETVQRILGLLEE
jgi:chloramphenicol 3-O-phosphotransferase